VSQTQEEIDSIVRDSEARETLDVSLTRRLDGKRGLLFLIKMAYEAECRRDWEGQAGQRVSFQQYLDDYTFEDFLGDEGLLEGQRTP